MSKQSHLQWHALAPCSRGLFLWSTVIQCSKVDGRDLSVIHSQIAPNGNRDFSTFLMFIKDFDIRKSEQTQGFSDVVKMVSRVITV